MFQQIILYSFTAVHWIDVFAEEEYMNILLDYENSVGKRNGFKMYG